MSSVVLCRVCLASNARMHHIANTQYQDIFEKLSTKLHTADRRPETVCYICYSQLQRCLRFMDMSRKAEEILTQFSLSGIELSEDTVTILDRKFVRKISWTPLQTLSINEANKLNQIKVEIKEESDNREPDATVSQHQISREKEFMDIYKTVTVKEEPKDVPLVGVNEKYENERSGSFKSINVKKELFSDDRERVGEEEFSMEEVKIKKELLEYGEFAAEVEIEGLAPQNEYEVSITNPEQLEGTGSHVQGVRVRYPCRHCDKAYKQRCHLYRHMKTHQLNSSDQPSRNYTCEICGKAFMQKGTLTKHFSCHTDEKRFSCEHCSTKCSQKIDMVRHMRMHTGQKPYKCDICKKKFSRKSNMKLHILTHADSKPFACNICNATFSRLYDLNRHKRRKHSGDKPYSCNICDFRSVNASYVKTHVKNKHFKLYSERCACGVCGFKCDNWEYLKRHMEKEHIVKEEPERRVRKVF